MYTELGILRCEKNSYCPKIGYNEADYQKCIEAPHPEYKQKLSFKPLLLGLSIVLTSLLAACGQFAAIPKPSTSPKLDTASIDDGLVGYWPFDENGKSKADHTANGNTMKFYGTLAADSSTADLNFPNPLAILFTGAPNSYGTAPGKGIDNLTSFTVSFWFRIPPGTSIPNGSYNVISLKNKVAFILGISNFNGFSNSTITMQNGNNFITALIDIRDNAEINITDKAYHYVVGSYDGQAMHLMVDGISSDNGIHTAGPSKPGNGILVGDPNLPYKADIDDLRIYNRVFRDNDINDWYICGRVTEIPFSECHALRTLFNSWEPSILTSIHTGHSNLDNFPSNWNKTPCKWYGITCLDGHVYSIVLPGNQLYNTDANGTNTDFPPELGDLTQLHIFDLRNNLFTGPLPDQLSKLTNLNLLALGGNKFTGSIPNAYSELTNLTGLDLSGNMLSGPIPNELGQLSKLQTLDLSGNLLSDSIPYSFGTMPNLKTLKLQNNKLHGMIPTVLGNASANMNLSYNMLSTNDSNLINALKMLAPGWETTQTLPPTNIKAKLAFATSVSLSWTPVTYTADGGYYDVLYMPQGGSTFTSAGHTTDKSASTFTINNLTPGQTYQFVIRTFTPKHPVTGQQNDLFSDSSDPVTLPLPSVNHAPVASNDTYTALKNTPLTIDAAHGILANDKDPDGDTIKLASISSSSAGAKLALNPDGSFTFTPPANYVGTISYTYKVTDGKLKSKNATIRFTIVRPGKITVHVYNDLNYSHQYEPSELLLAGWQVYVIDSNSAMKVLTTDSQGKAVFNNLMPGNYEVCQLPQYGWTNTLFGQVPGCYNQKVVANQNVDVWYGVVKSSYY